LTQSLQFRTGEFNTGGRTERKRGGAQNEAENQRGETFKEEEFLGNYGTVPSEEAAKSRYQSQTEKNASKGENGENKYGRRFDLREENERRRNWGGNHIHTVSSSGLASNGKPRQRIRRRWTGDITGQTSAKPRERRRLNAENLTNPINHVCFARKTRRPRERNDDLPFGKLPEKLRSETGALVK